MQKSLIIFVCLFSFNFCSTFRNQIFHIKEHLTNAQRLGRNNSMWKQVYFWKFEYAAFFSRQIGAREHVEFIVKNSWTAFGADKF